MPLAPKNELNVLTSEKQFVLNKTHFKNDFYDNHNSEKRSWFFEHFLQQRHIIQKKFYDFIELNRIQILFFDWFELYYASTHHVTYTFASIKHACPITTRSETPVWNLTSGSPVESDHPPLRNIQLNHKDQTIDAAPYKIPDDDTLINTKHIIQQNNFTNTNLNTLGKQLTWLEKQIQRTTISSIDTRTSVNLKLKNPIFKPYQVTKTSQTQIQENQIDFLKAIKTHLQLFDGSTLTIPDTSQTTNLSKSTNQVNTLQNSPVQTFVEEAFKDPPLELNRLTWQNSKKTIAPNISMSTEPTILNQHKCLFPLWMEHRWNVWIQLSKYPSINDYGS